MSLDPLTLAATAITATSAAVKGIAGFKSSQYQAAVAKMNKQIAEQNAQRAIDRAQVEQLDQDALTLAMIGEQEAIQSASGLSLGSRSFALTRKSARELGRKDALNVRQAGEIEKYNYLTDAANFSAQQGMAKQEGVFSLVQGFLDVGSSLVGGAKRSPAAGRVAPEPYTARLPRPRPTSLVR